MEYPIQPRPLMAHLLPGVYVEGVVALCQIDLPFDMSRLAPLTDIKTESAVLLLVLGLFFAALLFGHFCDAIRNLFEGVWDRDSSWWAFFVKLPEKKVATLTDHYFRYYELDANLVIASILLIPYLLWYHHLCVLLVIVIVTGVFFFDAKSLRSELRGLAMDGIEERCAKGESEKNAKQEQT